MLIVLEGLDGAGKSTQVKMISEYLQSMGKSVHYLHFPRFEAPVVGEMIARFLRGDFGPIESVHPMLVALLFAEDRRDAAQQMRQALSRGEVVLLDRYVYSNIAFQCAKLPELEAASLRDWIFNTEYGDFAIPRPDLNLFLDVPLSFVDRKLKEERTGEDRAYLQGKSDIHEADIRFQQQVRQVYLDQCRLDATFERVDCSDDQGQMLDPQRIFAKIKTRLDLMIGV